MEFFEKDVCCICFCISVLCIWVYMQQCGGSRVKFILYLKRILKFLLGYVTFIKIYIFPNPYSGNPTQLKETKTTP